MQKHSDVLIVGGGVIGLACAYYLAADGYQVRIIEQDQVGGGASHGNCGLIVISHLMPLCAPGVIKHELKRMFRRSSPLYIKPSLDIRQLAWLLHFAARCTSRHMEHAVQARQGILQISSRLYRDLFNKEKINCEWEQQGALLVYKSKAAMQSYHRNLAYLQQFGLEARPCVGDALFELEPALRQDIYGGWYHPFDSHLRPDLLLVEWKNVLTRNGVKIEENCRLNDLHPDGNRIRQVKTSQGAFSADTFILATGAWTPEITATLGLKLPVQPAKGYSITMARPALCPRIPCLFEEKSVVATPWKSGYRLGGTLDFSGFNTRIVAKRIQNLTDAARQYLKEPLGEPVLEEWVGLRPMVYDDLPVIDSVPGQRNLFVATGHGMMGMSLAPATGKLISELVSGQDPSIDVSPFSLKRFQP
jgi:D-amino-acid dehydrogenase